jgi:hypothetical protein
MHEPIHALTAEQTPESDPEYVAGMIEHDVREAIRDLVRLNGFERAREQIAFMLVDEADRRPRR